MYDISKVGEGFVWKSEAGVGCTISQFSNGSFLVPADLCYRVFLKRILCGFGLI